ncbi:apoptosis-antagonizing transcription factor, partial [Piptocephalis cylindrospora]
QKTKKGKSLGETLSELSQPKPTSFDPEDMDMSGGFPSIGGEDHDEAFDDDSADVAEAREHYVKVGKSKLRANQEILMDDPKYIGKKSTRSSIFGEEDRNEDSEEEVSEGEEEISEEEEEEESNDNQEESGSQDESEEDDLEKELREMEDQDRNQRRSLTVASESDAEKGRHIRNQITLWDAFLNARIRLQNPVALANRFPRAKTFQTLKEDKVILPQVQEAQKAVRGLLEALFTLRTVSFTTIIFLIPSYPSFTHPFDMPIFSPQSSLHPPLNTRLTVPTHPPLPSFSSFRADAIDRWSASTQLATGAPLNKKFKAINQDIRSQMDMILADKDRLIRRTQLKRTAVPVIGIEDQPTPQGDGQYDEEVFDDGDFYAQLLRELIEAKTAGHSTASSVEDPAAVGMRLAALKLQSKKNKKQVDRRASKGRKLRYEIHEKLVNFMVPIPTNTWRPEMVDELIGGLFGARQEDTSQSSGKEVEVEE